MRERTIDRRSDRVEQDGHFHSGRDVGGRTLTPVLAGGERICGRRRHDKALGQSTPRGNHSAKLRNTQY